MSQAKAPCALASVPRWLPRGPGVTSESAFHRAKPRHHPGRRCKPAPNRRVAGTADRPRPLRLDHRQLLVFELPGRPHRSDARTKGTGLCIPTWNRRRCPGRPRELRWCVVEENSRTGRPERVWRNIRELKDRRYDSTRRLRRFAPTSESRPGGQAKCTERWVPCCRFGSVRSPLGANMRGNTRGWCRHRTKRSEAGQFCQDRSTGERNSSGVAGPAPVFRQSCRSSGVPGQVRTLAANDLVRWARGASVRPI